MKTVSFVDTDPRSQIDPLYKTNMGSFSIVAQGFNDGLKAIGAYAEPDDADFVGICDAFNVGFKYKNKPVFIVGVCEIINTLPKFLVQQVKYYNPIMLGLSENVSRLWNLNGVKCETTMPGINCNFWSPGVDKRDGMETVFLFNSFANVRSGLDLAVEAFSKAFTKNDRTILVIKNTDSNPVLEKYLSESLRNCNFRYISGRFSFRDMRELYRTSDYSLNVMRFGTWGLGIHEALACGCIPIVGNYHPVMTKDLSILSINPIGEIRINDAIPGLVAKGLHNAYGNFQYDEEPLFYDYSIEEYAKLLRHLHENKIRPNVELERKKLQEKWSWEKAAQNLVNQLSLCQNC